MLGGFHLSSHKRPGLLHNAIERTFLTTGAMLIALVTLLILFFGVFFKLV
ncbi:MAG TPA: hypothetical protein VLY04_16760 [Bryobacteraceae bacterium]|nr:hypothetical protein [Bryobacteraceae bacterium]